MLLAVLLHKSHTSEKSGFWDMGQNALGQLVCRIFKSTISLKRNIKNWFFPYWYRIMEVESWFKNIGVSVVKNVGGHFSLRMLKLTVSQKGINGINWFLECW